MEPRVSAGVGRAGCLPSNGVTYPYNPNDGRENPPATYDECCRVLRGGSWYMYAEYLRCAYRNYFSPTLRIGSVGFRCARTD
mgnify:CR=1 FL=1